VGWARALKGVEALEAQQCGKPVHRGVVIAGLELGRTSLPLSQELEGELEGGLRSPASREVRGPAQELITEDSKGAAHRHGCPPQRPGKKPAPGEIPVESFVANAVTTVKALLPGINLERRQLVDPGDELE